jgi:hypothetical protein
MTHTIRIYNRKHIKKAQRYNVDDGLLHVISGIPYSRKSLVCMGHCKICRDHNKDQKKIRKQRKEQFRLSLKYEKESQSQLVTNYIFKNKRMNSDPWEI